MFLEFSVDRRPISHQASGKSRTAWKDYVGLCAGREWRGKPLRDVRLRCTIVYLSGEAPPDLDNIIKPILDSLKGLVYDDDVVVDDIHAHRRLLTDPITFSELPSQLFDLARAGKEGVFVRVEETRALEEELR